MFKDKNIQNENSGNSSGSIAGMRKGGEVLNVLERPDFKGAHEMCLKVFKKRDLKCSRAVARSAPTVTANTSFVAWQRTSG